MAAIHRGSVPFILALDAVRALSLQTPSLQASQDLEPQSRAAASLMTLTMTDLERFGAEFRRVLRDYGLDRESDLDRIMDAMDRDGDGGLLLEFVRAVADAQRARAMGAGAQGLSTDFIRKENVVRQAHQKEMAIVASWQRCAWRTQGCAWSLHRSTSSLGNRRSQVQLRRPAPQIGAHGRRRGPGTAPAVAGSDPQPSWTRLRRN